MRVIANNITLRYVRFCQKILPQRQSCILSTTTFATIKNFTNNYNTTFKNTQNQLLIDKYSQISAQVKYFCDKRQKSSNTESNAIDETSDDDKQLTKWQQFKKMYKEYWYVILPVHLVTSAGWFVGFYYIATTGFDIVGYMEYYNVNEMFIKPLRDSTMGYIAVAYALYKIFTPLRYTVTLGGTTIAINYLRKRGYIKPVPTKSEIKEMYVQKKGEIQESLRETKKGLQQRKQNITEDLAHYRHEMKSIHHQTKKTIG